MKWPCAACVVVCLMVCTLSRAQPMPEPRDGKVVLPLTLSPASAPQPVSRSYLLPQYAEMQPGNRVQGFMKAFMEQQQFFSREPSSQRDKWNSLPLEQLPLDEIRKAGILHGMAYTPPYGRPLGDADEAARYTRVEWNEWFNIRRDGIHWLLPELQNLRNLATALKVRLRAEIKAGDFDRAIVSLRTLFGLARTMEQHPTLIGQLIGLFIAGIGLDALEEMVQQPGCPNLYWALVDLPRPLIDPRQGLQGERVLLSEQFKPLLQANGGLSEREVQRYLTTICELFRAIQINSDGDQAAAAQQRYRSWAADKARVELARRRLAATGFKPTALKDMSALQLVLTDDLRQYEIYRDELFKWFPLPYWQAAPGLQQAEQALQKAKEELQLAPQMVSGTRVRQSQARFEQRIALLQIVEAIRLYAHANRGQLPDSLDKIRLPLPLDPVSGQPFRYTVEADRAILHGANLYPDKAATNRHYTLQIRK